eukprot:TRINITY_DN9528_c0_g1_i10.p1 TRINITY_DN9528_c0_g1~~TRINITY_DN9528_c0_g1_i10.p1  ORF type:complete len:1270 (-),score=388.22 TRINITY_DN9528_c0_g1_i10:486-4295(-)
MEQIGGNAHAQQKIERGMEQIGGNMHAQQKIERGMEQIGGNMHAQQKIERGMEQIGGNAHAQQKIERGMEQIGGNSHVQQKIERGMEQIGGNAHAQQKIERGMEQIGGNTQAQQKIDRGMEQMRGNIQMQQQNSNNNLVVPDHMERIQKSDSIIELRQKNMMSMSSTEQQHQQQHQAQQQQLQQQRQQQLQQQQQMAALAKENSPAYQKAVSTSPRSFAEARNAEAMSNLSVNNLQPIKSSSLLQVPSIASPPDSEDQTTPQAVRKPFLPSQVSIESTNSFSEPDESNENLAPQLRSLKEDPETKKKKEIHKSLMSEALKKVELRNIQKKQQFQLSRTNPSVAALDIDARKQLRMEELESKTSVEQDIVRPRNRSGSSKLEASSATAPASISKVGEVSPGVNQNVLQTFRQQSIVKPRDGASFAAKEAALQAKKTSATSKPEASPKPVESGSESVQEPIVILKKQPRILGSDEITARQSSIEKSKFDTKSQPQQLKRESQVKSPDLQRMSPIVRNATTHSAAPLAVEKADALPEARKSSAPPPVVKQQERTINNANAVAQQQQKGQSNEPTLSAKQTLKNITEVRPKSNTNDVKVGEKRELIVAEEDRQKKTSTVEESSSKNDSFNYNNDNSNYNSSGPSSNNNSKTASVKKAAEKYEIQTASQGRNSPNSNLHLRMRSKSIGNSRKELFEDGKENAKENQANNLPWAVKSAGHAIPKKKSGMKDKNYALQMSKSSDSITAAKLLAKARSENNSNSGLRINQNFSKSIEQQIDVYSKTKEEIRMILTLAKSGSVNDRIALFSNMVNKSEPPVDPDEKAESIRREIEEARANAQETVSDTEIEFQEPIESKVKPLKIPMKPKLVGNNGNNDEISSLRINQTSRSEVSKERRPSVEELPCLKSKISSYKAAAEEATRNSQLQQNDQKIKPILVKKNENERSRSPRKKTPKLVSDHYLSPNEGPFQIYTQSATDMSATEDELEAEKNRKISMPAKLPSQDPGPGFLKVPPRAQAENNNRFGLMKSKSFASPGQFECSIDNDLITSKKQTMMSFFSKSKESMAMTSTPTMKPKSIMKQPTTSMLQQQVKQQQLQHPQRRNSLTSITDEVICDEDLEDIDEEFENLLTQTFERESNRHGGNDMTDSRGGARGIGGGGKQAGGGGLRKTSGNSKNNSLLQKSKSFSASSPPTQYTTSGDSLHPFSSVANSAGDYFYSDNMNKKMQEGFDPLAALPTSSRGGGAGAQGGPRSPPPMYNSPSPTPSEYDTADPDSYD